MGISPCRRSCTLGRQTLEVAEAGKVLDLEIRWQKMHKWLFTEDGYVVLGMKMLGPYRRSTTPVMPGSLFSPIREGFFAFEGRVTLDGLDGFDIVFADRV